MCGFIGGRVGPDATNCGSYATRPRGAPIGPGIVPSFAAVRPMGVEELNLALVAERKRKEGESLSAEETATVFRFRDLYRDVSEIAERPGVRNALLDVLEHDLSFLTEVPANPLLAQHLRALRERNTPLTIADVRDVRELAKKLCDKEEEAISASMTAVALRAGAEPGALEALSSYVDGERAQRAAHQSGKKTRGWLAAIGIGATIALAVPLMFWFPPLGAAVAKLGAT